jgi:hypothetical protein
MGNVVNFKKKQLEYTSVLSNHLVPMYCEVKNMSKERFAQELYDESSNTYKDMVELTILMRRIMKDN